MSQPTASFATCAEAFCSWADAQPSGFNSDVTRARYLLAALYHEALALPPGEVTDEPQPQRISAEVWAVLYQRFGTLPVGMCACCLEPLVLPPSEPCIGDLADDLADIYRDIHAGLQLYRSGRHQEAAWEWRFHFEVHWGQHALDALRALHAYSSSSQDQDDSGAA